MHKIVVKVPATSANCGPGFDTLGLALELYNTFSFEEREENSISYEGLGAEMLAHEKAEDSLKAFTSLFEAVGEKAPKGHFTSQAAIPPSRGLGSSATAIVGGLTLANALVKEPLSKEKILELATALEGHPDNVCPAIFGHLTAAVSDEHKVLYTQVPVARELSFVLVVPEYAMSTKEARAVLPDRIDYKKAVKNVGFASLFITAMMQKRWDILPTAMQDYLHIPYRIALLKGGQKVLEAGVKAGALGTTISGSGSTLIAYTLAHGDTIGKAMVDAFHEEGIEAKYYIVKGDETGALVIS